MCVEQSDCLRHLDLARNASDPKAEDWLDKLMPNSLARIRRPTLHVTEEDTAASLAAADGDDQVFWRHVVVINEDADEPSNLPLQKGSPARSYSAGSLRRRSTGWMTGAAVPNASPPRALGAGQRLGACPINEDLAL